MKSCAEICKVHIHAQICILRCLNNLLIAASNMKIRYKLRETAYSDMLHTAVIHQVENHRQY